MKHSLLCKIGACALAASLLGGCSVWESFTSIFASDTEIKCPDARILFKTSVLPAFAPGKGEDPSDLVYTVTMTSADLDCDYRKKKNKADSDIHVTFRAERPSGGPAAVYKVPYFLTLTTEGRVLFKKVYWKTIAFEKGASSSETDVDIEDLVLMPRQGHKPINYHYVLGFQLTQAQLDYVKKMGQYTP